MAADDAQAQIEALQAQLQLAQLKAQLAELERQKSTEPPAAAPPAPAELAVPAPLPEVVPPVLRLQNTHSFLGYIHKQFDSRIESHLS